MRKRRVPFHVRILLSVVARYLHKGKVWEPVSVNIYQSNFHFNANNVIFPIIINGNKARNIATNSAHKATLPTALPTLRQIFFLILMPLILIT